jgi:hypothetical protein
MNVCYSENILLQCVSCLPVVPCLRKIVCQYAASFPIIFTDYEDKCWGFFSGSKHIQQILFVDKVLPKFYFQFADVGSGTMIFAKREKLQFFSIVCTDENILAQKCSAKDAERRFAARFIAQQRRHIKKLDTLKFGEYIIGCDCSVSDNHSVSLFVGISWGWGNPQTYLLFQQNESPPVKKRLYWDYPSETCNYRDGWVVQLYYIDEHLWLVTEDAIYTCPISVGEMGVTTITTNHWTLCTSHMK